MCDQKAYRAIICGACKFRKLMQRTDQKNFVLGIFINDCISRHDNLSEETVYYHEFSIDLDKAVFITSCPDWKKADTLLKTALTSVSTDVSAS